ncbi:MarR family winged helix-turn-helix transcriptional regulator [Brevibacterium samyangense]|uniref:MarR family transcriptional regulator n=1 Tax=Brevibacterium samyangense TaxID=366888 RepID=A0ABP5EWT9_9MICO
MTESDPTSSSTDAQPEAPEVRWLSPAEQHAWRHSLESFELLISTLDRELRASHGLAMSEYEIFVRLSERPDHTMRMAELADDLAISRSRLTHIVTKMEKQGWVVRSASAADGRGVECRMTEAGYALLVDSAPVHVRGVREHLIDQLTPEETAALGSAFEKVNAHLRSVRTRP